MPNKTKWFKPSNRPAYAPGEDNFSVSVLIYDTENDYHTVGWFDFQQDTWSYESQSEISKNFVWCELPKPE